MAGRTPTNPSAASRIQSSQAKANNPTGKGSFPARVQSAAATNVNKKIVDSAPKATPTGAAKAPTAKPARK